MTEATKDNKKILAEAGSLYQSTIQKIEKEYIDAIQANDEALTIRLESITEKFTKFTLFITKNLID